MTDLSPAAQAVLDAAIPALNNLDACGFNHQRYDCKALAAALRAVADQVVPEQQIPRGHFVDLGGGVVEVFPQSARGPIQRLRLLQEVRSALLAFATELEGR